MFTSVFWQHFNSEQAHTLGFGGVQTNFLVHYSVSSEQT